MKKIAIVDYGAGNLASVGKALAAVGCEVSRCASGAELLDADAIVVPGVGHFDATSAITEDLRTTIRRRVATGVPLLGICLGMQWLFDGSEEAPGLSGLGFLSGRSQRLRADRPLKVPHVGWNELTITAPSALLQGVDDGAYVYFTHSFAAPVTEYCAASATHGQTFAAAVERGNVAGVQFHPEKSGDAGLRILRNFVAMARG